MPLHETLGVFLAGGLGATLRVSLVPLIDAQLAHRLPFVGTLGVNLLGCFLIGLAGELVPPAWRAIVLGGFLGGFTTYSAFALLKFSLFESGQTAAGLAHIALHIVLGLGLAAAGVWLGRSLPS